MLEDTTENVDDCVGSRYRRSVAPVVEGCTAENVDDFVDSRYRRPVAPVVEGCTTENVDDCVGSRYRRPVAPVVEGHVDDCVGSRYRRPVAPVVEGHGDDCAGSRYRHTVTPVVQRRVDDCVGSRYRRAVVGESANVRTSKNATRYEPQTNLGPDTVRNIELYRSPQVDSALNGHTMISSGSSATENDRQLRAIDSVKILNSCTLHQTLMSTLSTLLGLHTDDADRLSLATSKSNKLRDLQVRLSMNDPLLSEQHRIAHTLYVAGKSLSELRAAGVEAQHLCEIGVTYTDWCGCYELGIQDLVFLKADWNVLCKMGFIPRHIVENRAKSGPVVLAKPPLNVTFQLLEQTLGLTIDESVFQLGFTTADFSVLGENLTTMTKRGFNATHARHMSEPTFNFETVLGGTQSMIDQMFCTETNNTVKVVPSDSSRSFFDKIVNVGKSYELQLAEKPRQLQCEKMRKPLKSIHPKHTSSKAFAII